MGDCRHAEPGELCRLKAPEAPLRLAIHMELFARGHVGIGVDARCPFPVPVRGSSCPFFEP